jgi:uncharacterized protein (DUF983 family)
MAKHSRPIAILLQRCPRCLSGDVYHGFASMHENCPQCDLKFGREPGYFTGAMCASYLMSVPFLVVTFIALRLLFGEQQTLIATWFLTLPIFLPFAIVIFRYSRVIWLHIDWKVDPDASERQV